MPNWCENRLTITCAENTKAALAQLAQFISDVKEEGQKVKMEDAEKFRQDFIESNFDEKYRDALDSYTAHQEMDISKFMTQVCYFEQNDNIFQSNHTEFSMHKLFPVPMDLLNPILDKPAESKKLRVELQKKYGFESWYDWRIANWGTKWDVKCNQIDGYPFTKEYITYYFDTAWSPPTEFLKEIAPKYPLLTFFLGYEEPGMAFQGELQITKGEVDFETQEDMESDFEDDDETTEDDTLLQ